MTFKLQVYNKCRSILDEKISLLTNLLSDLTKSIEGESKSSAGDKHETSRAMMQIEYVKISRQLSEAVSQQAILNKIDCNIKSPKITSGSLIKTQKGFLFICIALGKINVDAMEVIALSPQSPLGNKLIGLKAADAVSVNGTNYTIESIE